MSVRSKSMIMNKRKHHIEVVVIKALLQSFLGDNGIETIPTLKVLFNNILLLPYIFKAFKALSMLLW